jgi:hypothetical protein
MIIQHPRTGNDAPARIRTRDLNPAMGVLYPLSYGGNRPQREPAEPTQRLGRDAHLEVEHAEPMPN